MINDLIFQIVTTVGPLILAITVHEFSHVAMARFLGDNLGTKLGRFTLDPLKHIDPVWTVGLPIMLVVMSTLSGGASLPFFAAGKPAPYNPLALKKTIFGKRISMRFAELMVAAAGPISNLILAILSMLLLSVAHVSLAGLVLQFIYLNVALFVFNLIPIPPLDGSKVLMAFLPHDAAVKYESIGHSLSWVLFGLIIMGGGQLIGSLVRLVVRGLGTILL